MMKPITYTSAQFWFLCYLPSILPQKHYNSAVLLAIYQMGKIVRNALIAWLALTVNCCFVGEYTNVDDTCKQCDISCNTCKSSDGCSTCYGQMYLMTRGNMVVCEVCYRVNKGCAVCLTASKCSTCSNGYFLQDDNTCISCATMYPHCMLCTSNNSTS